jgi:hypothetical protein
VYDAFGRERKWEVLERYARSPYIGEQTSTYPNNPDKDGYLESLERLRHVMILFKLGYGSRGWRCSRSTQAESTPRLVRRSRGS